jgi:hypothetical protein
MVRRTKKYECGISNMENLKVVRLQAKIDSLGLPAYAIISTEKLINVSVTDILEPKEAAPLSRRIKGSQSG